MLGGSFFDNIWDPYSPAYAYPRNRYYRPRADRHEDRTMERPSNKSSLKTVKTIPVTDGGAPDMKPVAKSEDAAATEIQAFYRGYAVRKTQPLQHLRLIEKVKGELESLKFKSQQSEQEVKLRSDAKERVRWMEGVMALLLRLDSLQGVHPEVRLIRKAVTKELLCFQEAIDSMSIACAESNDGISEETIGSSDASAPEVVEEMEMEGSNLRCVLHDFVSGNVCDNASDDQGIKSNEDPTSEKLVPSALSTVDNHVNHSDGPNCDGNGVHVGETTVEVGFLSEPTSSEALPEAPKDAENKEQLSMMSPARDMGEGEVVLASSQSLPPEIGNQEASRVENSTATDMRRREAEMDISQCGVNGVAGDNTAHSEEKETTCMDGRIIPARISMESLSLEPQCKQDDEVDNLNALSDRALLLVLEENRKLKNVLGKVLLWGKQQSDVIENLTHRIEQLEEHQSPSSKLLQGKDRKRVRRVDNRERSRRRLEKGRRNRRLLAYVDSEDEYF